MKDLEKIKSEDLGCQVQDANPGNFAIEQEVGAMVGATVPAPTAPSADDARELGAQLLVFLRRALTPIQSALRTALAAIYAHLDSRCTAYTPAAYAPYTPTHHAYDPMGSSPRTLPNLLTAITAFAPRKISNGSAPNDGIPDGVSLAHIVAGTDALSVTKIVDDNHGWEFWNNAIFSIYPSVTEWSLNCKKMRKNPSYGDAYYNYGQGFLKGNNTVTKLELPEFEGFYGGAAPYTGIALYCYYAANCANIEQVLLPSMWNFTGENSATNTNNISQCPKLWRVLMGDITAANGSYYYFYQCPKLIDLEFKSVQVSLNLANWNPSDCLSGDALTTFLQNFLEHICQRLANRTGQTKLTLTLSAAVYTAIMTDNDIKAELVARNWKVTDGTNNYNN